MSLIAPEYSVLSLNTIKARIDKVYDEEKSKFDVGGLVSDMLLLYTK